MSTIDKSIVKTLRAIVYAPRVSPKGSAYETILHVAELDVNDWVGVRTLADARRLFMRKGASAKMASEEGTRLEITDVTACWTRD